MYLYKLRRKIHISWLIMMLSIAFVIGVVMARFFRFNFIPDWVYFLVSIVLILVVLIIKRVYLVPILIIGGVLLGWWRGGLLMGDLSEFDSFYGKIVQVEGVVKDDVDIDGSGQLTIRLGDLKVNERRMAGVIWATSNEKMKIERGDRILMSGKLTEGFGGYTGVIYRGKVLVVERLVPGDVARVVRDWFSNLVRRTIPDPEASLGLGYLLGQRRALPVSLVEALQLTGLTHVVVASGYNLTILVRMTRRAFAKISKYLATFLASAMMFSFIAITGLSPSMFRAGLVTGLSLLAWYYGRKFNPLVLLFFVMAITVVINPSYAWGDLGWQLSFGAFAGVMILAPLLQAYFFGKEKIGLVRQILIETVSAQLFTMPIIVLSFSQISNVAIFSNLLILPLVPITMLATFVAGVGVLIVPFFADFLALPAIGLLKYMIFAVNKLAELPWVMSGVEISELIALISYIVLTAACFYMWQKTKVGLGQTNLIE